MNNDFRAQQLRMLQNNQNNLNARQAQRLQYLGNHPQQPQPMQRPPMQPPPNPQFQMTPDPRGTGPQGAIPMQQMQQAYGQNVPMQGSYQGNQFSSQMGNGNRMPQMQGGGWGNMVRQPAITQNYGQAAQIADAVAMQPNARQMQRAKFVANHPRPATPQGLMSPPPMGFARQGMRRR